MTCMFLRHTKERSRHTIDMGPQKTPLHSTSTTRPETNTPGPLGSSNGASHGSPQNSQLRIEVHTTAAAQYASSPFAGIRLPSLNHLHDLAFGQKIFHGMYITFGAGASEIHIANTELEPILTSIRSYSHSISDAVERYQGITGVTPSKKGLRVFALVLGKVVDGDAPALQVIRELRKDALSIDLAAPSNPTWSRSLTLSINGSPIKATLSIEPLTSVVRTLVSAIKTEVPEEDRNNRYGYRLTMEPETFTESSVVRKLKSLCRQAVSLTALCSPIAAAEYAISTGMLRAIMPTISNQPVIQHGLIELAHLGVLACVGAATYFAVQAYRKALFHSADS